MLDSYILKRVRDIFAVVRRLFEELVNLLQLQEYDRVFLIQKEVAHGIAHELIRYFLQPVDLNEVLDYFFVRA